MLSAQPPAITQEGVRNAASRMPPSLPGGSLAPGAQFTIEGLRLSATGLETRVRIAQGGVSVDAPVISAGEEQIEARVPMEIRPGAGELTVIRGGQISRAFALRIAPAAFGIFAQNGSGWGPGQVVNEDANPNTPAEPARPGSVVTLFGTGWGAARTAEVYAGGRRARFLSHTGKAGDTGVDEVRFQLPADMPQGCYVPLAIKLAGQVSNFVTLAVSRAGKPCAGDPRASGLVLLARVRMHIRLSAGHPVEFPQDMGVAIFPQVQPGAPPNAWEMLPPVGTCTNITGRRSGDLWASGGLPFAALPGRDAGPGLTVTGPNRTATLLPAPREPGLYLGWLGGGRPLHAKPFFLDPGRYTISASGGKDVGAFSASADFHPILEWLRPERLGRIDRTRGARVEWSGASTSQRVLVAAVNVDPLSGGAGVCLCVAPGSAGRMELPALYLSNLPASRNMPGLPQGYLLIAGLPEGRAPEFHARGLEIGFLLLVPAFARSVEFK